MGTFIESLAAFEKAVNAVMDEVGRTEPMVRICFSGRKTVAELVKNGRVVKSADARCNPKDTYSRADGAKIAVERLFEKKSTGKAKEVSKPKICDKFVVIGNEHSPHHCFKKGEIVTIAQFYKEKIHIFENECGKNQYVNELDVKPYKGEAK